MARDYYATLGVSAKADPRQIREAYHRLVRESHPDISGADTREQFRAIQEAWHTLSDAERRRRYDTAIRNRGTGTARLRSPTGRPSPSETRGWQEWMDDFFAGVYAALSWPKDRRVLDFGLEMSADEATRGGEMRLQFPVLVPCNRCRGTGRGFRFLCRACHGRGYQHSFRPVILQVPSDLKQGAILEVPLDDFGCPDGRMMLHVQIHG